MEASDAGERTCPSCGVSIGPAASYCPSCGDSLPDGKGHYCHRCGTEFDRGDEFCSSCGASRYRDVTHEGDQTTTGDHAQTTGPVGQDQAWEQTESTAQDTVPDEEAYERFKRRVNGHLEEGWEIHEDQGDRVVLVKRDVGSLWIHALLLLFTYGVGNIFYALYRYTSAPSYKRLTVGDGQNVRRQQATSAEHGRQQAQAAASGGSDGAMYLVGGILLLWGLVLMAVGSVGPLLVGGLLSALGLAVLPPVSERLSRRRSVSSFGTVTSTEDRTVENDPATCVVCGAPTEHGLEREYKKERVLAGVPVLTVESGTNRYCPDCALAHAVGSDDSHSDTAPDDEESGPVDEAAINDELESLFEESPASSSEPATDEPPTDDPEQLESWEFGADR